MPCGPINSIAEMASDPQRSRAKWWSSSTIRAPGATRALGLPIKLSATPGRVARPAPLLGQHTREVLGEYGFSSREIEELVRMGAAVAA